MNIQKTALAFIFINLISSLSYGLSWAELMAGPQDSPRTTRTPFIMLATRAFDETQADAQSKLEGFSSRYLSQCWLSSKKK
jgi:hypothetical protein